MAKEDRCDNCGACKKCGAGGRPTYVPMPYVVYPYTTHPPQPVPYRQPLTWGPNIYGQTPSGGTNFTNVTWANQHNTGGGNYQ